MKTKSFCAFIIALSSIIPSFACGPFYPWGDEVRFSLFRSSFFKTDGLQSFTLNLQSVSPDDVAIMLGMTENCKLWQERVPGVSEDDVFAAVYQASPQNNAFMNALIERKDGAAIKYLVFAKECEAYNNFEDDEWERPASDPKSSRHKMMLQALSAAAETTDEMIRQRYAFLAIRLAFYDGDVKTVGSAFNKHFKSAEKKDILYYWALYFFALVQEDEALKNMQLAQVFVHAPDKRFVVWQHYDKSADQEKTLKKASTREEKANVIAVEAVWDLDETLESIKKVRELDPNSEMLEFLVLREINKLEDWLLTPHYSEFEPSTKNGYWSMSDEDMESGALEKAKKELHQQDLNYAIKLHSFIDEQLADNDFTRLSKAQLRIMVSDFKGSMAITEKLLSSDLPEDKKRLAAQLHAIALTVTNTNNSIPDFVQEQLIIAAKNEDSRFIFAIARELEYKGKTTDAAILLFQSEKCSTDEYYEHGYGNEDYYKSVFWKSKSGFYTLYMDYYYDYYFYLDAEYTIVQLTDLISDLSSAKASTEFEKWKYSGIKKDIPRLYDLLGTKYLRIGNHTEAMNAYRLAGSKLYKQAPYSDYLDGDPFYTDFNKEFQASDPNGKTYNKYSMMKKYLEYEKLAEDSLTKNREYYYFLLANCEFNMSYYGHSWLMKRYFWSAGRQETGLSDDKAYFQCEKAKELYAKAASVARNPKFRHLSLAMAGRCEYLAMLTEAKKTYEEYPEKSITTNSFYRKLYKESPEDYEELVSNCAFFDSYFQTGKR